MSISTGSSLGSWPETTRRASRQLGLALAMRRERRLDYWVTARELNDANAHGGGPKVRRFK